MTENTNPLGKYYRQPQIYITLPSRGKYYTQDVFTPTETGEIPVLPMTAKDELSFKTPDSMMSGQSTVDVIQSCVPNFKNAWKMVNFDTDAVLLAIRIATYGETMDVNYKVPVTNEDMTHTANLPALLEELGKINIVDEATTKTGFTVKLAPLDYQSLSQIQTAQFEQQKIYATVSNSALSEKDKSTQFVKSFKVLNNINFSMLVDSITEITTPEGTTVVDKGQIKDFCDNCDAKVINEIQDELAIIRSQAQIKPIKLQSTEEQIKKGAPTSYEVPVTFDSSNFFA
jgi:hypothetical protein|tara:strand:- start:202 stop:1059 length:858 start_codon:yes stop_codon:yes gene_type:complete